MDGVTNITGGLTVNGVPTMGVSGIPWTGNAYFVDPVNGADGNPGTVNLPLQTLTQAYTLARDGYNDVIYLIGNGQTSGTARLSATLTWAKNALHLIGITAPTCVAQRARIAATSGVNFTPLVNVTGAGCMFANISTFHGYNSAVTQICWVAGGQRNYYENVTFGGMGDATAAAQTGSRSLVVGVAASGQGENTFVGCTIGLDTIARSAANYSLEFIGGTPRNVFKDCIFPAQISAATAAFIRTAAAASIDRFQDFEGCRFINNVASTSTTMTQACVLTASSGGLLLMNRCTTVGVTAWETSPTNQIYLDGAPPTAASSGLAVINA